MRRASTFRRGRLLPFTERRRLGWVLWVLKAYFSERLVMVERRGSDDTKKLLATFFLLFFHIC